MAHFDVDLEVSVFGGDSEVNIFDYLVLKDEYLSVGGKRAMSVIEFSELEG